MRRSIVRLVSVLALTAGLALSTMAAPAFAGDLGGAGTILIPFLQSQPTGTCAFVEDETTEHYFLGVTTGTTPPTVRISAAISLPSDPDLSAPFGPKCINRGEFCEPTDTTCVTDQ